MRLTKKVEDKAVFHVCEKPCLACKGTSCGFNQAMVDRLASYEDAEEQGRMVILPKTLYEADTTPLITGVTEWEVTGVRFYDGVVQAYIVKTKNVQNIILGKEIGKTVFLTREEAEAAWKGES